MLVPRGFIRRRCEQRYGAGTARTLGRARGGARLWGSRKWPELVTCTDRVTSDRHDHCCVAVTRSSGRPAARPSRCADRPRPSAGRGARSLSSASTVSPSGVRQASIQVPLARPSSMPMPRSRTDTEYRSCFAVFVDQVPAAAQAARTARVSCGVACSGHGPRNLAATMTRRSLTAMSS
jgi:hypothetical protein